MIETDAQLAQAIGQIERLYEGLNALLGDILLHKNPRNFAVLAEGPLEEIRKLQAAIDGYMLRLASAGAVNRSARRAGRGL